LQPLSSDHDPMPKSATEITEQDGRAQNRHDKEAARHFDWPVKRLNSAPNGTNADEEGVEVSADVRAELRQVMVK
jgi:hypothetical protein